MALFLAPLALSACGGVDETLGEEGSVLSAEDGKEDGATIQFVAFNDDIGSVGTSETRKVITSAKGYAAYFGHAAPVEVDFSSEWVVFYSAGVKATGGYQATVKKIALSNSGKTLKVTTALESPGRECIVTQAFTKPNALVKLKRQKATWVQFYAANTTRDCSQPQCTVDADCVAVDDYCTGCDCRALGVNEELPLCEGPGVRCFAQPCMAKTAVCKAGRCEIAAVQLGVKCGANTCAVGQVCCNSSCGICTPPDGFCTQQICN